MLLHTEPRSRIFSHRGVPSTFPSLDQKTFKRGYCFGSSCERAKPPIVSKTIEKR